MSETNSAPVNIHGRGGGRGIRPWLLFPKYVFVSIFLGGLFSMLVLGFLQPDPATLPEWRFRERLLADAYVKVIVIPGLLGAIVFGIALILTHFRAFIRMRWLQVKLILAAICIPSLHFYMRGKATELHNALTRGTPRDLVAATSLWHDLRNGTIVTIVFALVLIFLARLKPRLGQNYARAFTAPAPSAQPTIPPSTATADPGATRR